MGKEIILKSVGLPNGETLAYRVAGAGNKNLLLIHGNLSSSLNWDLLMENLPEDIRAISVDLRGFGRSSYNKPINTIKDLADDLKLFIEELDIDNLTVAGWSAGGTVAMQLAADYPVHIEGLILIESSSIKGYPVGKLDESGRIMKENYIRTKEEMEKLLMPFKNVFEKKDLDAARKYCDSAFYMHNKPNEERYSKYIEEMIKQRNIADFNHALSVFNISHVNNGIVDGTGEVDRIRMPTLIIQGGKDTLVTRRMAEDIRHGIGENAKIKELPGSGHAPFVDDLKGLTDLVVNFIKGV